MEDDSLLAGWVPCRLYWKGPCPWIDWCYLGEYRFTEPFFEQTIHRCFREPFRALFRHQTSIEVLAGLDSLRSVIPPTGFIFHLSRCGSTLISQMLAALPQNIVISEAGPIDFALRACPPAGEPSLEQRVRWIRWIVSALGHAQHPMQRHYFIKFDSWHTLLLPLLLEVFPETPWIFVYRDPVEVMVSHQRQRGLQVVPGFIHPRLLGIDPTELADLSLDTYMARVLARFCGEAVSCARRGHGLLVNYRQLPEIVMTATAAHFRIAFEVEDLTRLQEASFHHAKRPSLRFDKDSEAKQRDASPELKALAATWLDPLFQQLEQIRTNTETR